MSARVACHVTTCQWSWHSAAARIASATLTTSFYLVYCSHESISPTGTFCDASNFGSKASAFQFSISCSLWSSISSWLPPSLPGPGPSESSPTSRIAALQAQRSWRACRPSSTTQYLSRLSWSYDCGVAGWNSSLSVLQSKAQASYGQDKPEASWGEEVVLLQCRFITQRNDCQEDSTVNEL
jgi:hypothetical protein